MQIVIDILDDEYKKLVNPYQYNEALCDKLKMIVRNGTPLPKGHGRLIDVNDLLDRIGLEDNDTNREENVGEIITLEDFDYTPTIIESDESELESED